MRRKPRSDSTYVIYAATHDGNCYIGVTRRGSRAAGAAVRVRWQKHISRARCESKDWLVYEYIRAGAWTNWEHEVIEQLRGRRAAYARERELVKELAPSLNTQYA